MVGKLLVQTFVPGIIVLLVAGAYKILAFVMEVCGLDIDADSLTPRSLEGATDVSSVVFMSVVSVLFLYLAMALLPINYMRKFIKWAGIEIGIIELILYAIAIASSYFLIKLFNRLPALIVNIIILLTASALFTALTIAIFDFERQEATFWPYYRWLWYTIWMFIYVKVMQIIDPI